MAVLTTDARRKALALKTMDALQPSVGDYKEFAKRLRYLHNKELQRYKRAALQAARQYIKLSADKSTQDAKLPHSIKEYLGIATECQLTTDAKDPPYTFNKLYAEAMARARIRSTQERARDISYWFCRKLLRNINHRMRRNLKAAGISAQWLQKRWTVPVIKGQYVSPEAAKGLAQYVKHITNLITQMSAKSHLKVQDAIAKGLMKGYNIKELTAALEKLENMNPARAERVARDQSCKLNQFIQRENLKAIGITEGIWRHVPGMYTFRDSHKHLLNGQKFDLSKGIYDPEVGFNILPGDLPYCRCVFSSVIPDNLQTGT